MKLKAHPLVPSARAELAAQVTQRLADLLAKDGAHITIRGGINHEHGYYWVEIDSGPSDDAPPVPIAIAKPPVASLKRKGKVPKEAKPDLTAAHGKCGVCEGRGKVFAGVGGKGGTVMKATLDGTNLDPSLFKRQTCPLCKGTGAA